MKNIVGDNGAFHLFGIVQSYEERHALRRAVEEQAEFKAVREHLLIVPVAYIF